MLQLFRLSYKAAQILIYLASQQFPACAEEVIVPIDFPKFRIHRNELLGQRAGVLRLDLWQVGARLRVTEWDIASGRQERTVGDFIDLLTVHIVVGIETSTVQ